jgi:predicted AAA+ superfamily ATPase
MRLPLASFLKPEWTPLDSEIDDLERAIIGEVQLAPELLRAIKESIDNDRRPGRFLLTGSANILTLPRISESLAGRMEIVTLLPLSRAEIRRHRPAFLQNAFAGKLVRPAEKMIAADLTRAVLVGGYSEMLEREQPERGCASNATRRSSRRGACHATRP